MAPQTISTHQGVEHDLYEHGAEGAFAYSASIEGHAFYYLTIPKANRTWVFDETTGSWHERSTFDAYYVAEGCEHKGYGAYFANCSVMHNGKAYIGAEGGIYELDLNYFKDGDKPILREAVATPVQIASNGVIYKRVRLEFQNSCSRVGDCSENPHKVALYWSDNQGKDWKGGDEKPIAIDGCGDYLPTWTKLGGARKRAFKWRTFAQMPIVFLQSFFDVEAKRNARV